jgi:hypothetical protein
MLPEVAAAIPSSMIAEIIREIALTVAPHRGLNERYIHHAFSHRVGDTFVNIVGRANDTAFGL